MAEFDLDPPTEMTLPESLLELFLIDLVVFHYPQLELQVGVLESKLLNESTLADIIIDPKAVWHEMFLTPGIGEKARRELSKVVLNALSRAYPREWEKSGLHQEGTEQTRMPGLTRQLALVRTVWKISDPTQSQPRKLLSFSTRRQRPGYH